MRTIETDCLVLGAGLAGSAYALHAARAGLRVELLSLAEPLAANSDWAQGGIIYGAGSDPAQLARDILEASAGTANPAAIDQLVREGPAAVKDLLLDELHVDFDRRTDGELDFTREGGHRERRIIHTRDTTGHSILAAVAAKVDATPGITRRTGHVAVDLLTLSHNAADPAQRYEPLTCFGGYALDTASGEVVAITARKTILATGGLGGIFLHSTNQPGSVGHGVAMAYRVGARLIDLEYVQFHPTVFFPRDGAPFLITEALRGEGAVIVDARGRRFMDQVHPLGSLAPRDIVARSISQHLAATGDACAFLDLSALKPEFIRERFPAIHARCLAAGLDITRERIPVVPAAHFSCGGVHTDLQGRTNVRDLNAIGETACTGLHGANRLASTSLLECLVSARAAANADIVELLSRGGALANVRNTNIPIEAAARKPLPDEEANVRITNIARPTPREWRSPAKVADPLLLQQDLHQIRQTMWNYAGIIRSPRRLARARRILLELREDIQAFYRDCRPTRELIELRNAVQTALLVVHAASLNPVSKGCHYVADEN
ncbi:L-aspartate oxidase [Oleiharenicola sp. Vm1]|uniref:L-aspartate oxidase n=1 Tax=Oleiharenicola sp. Vm1 TaxID=3398393 RepID=UPI0039F636A2